MLLVIAASEAYFFLGGVKRVQCFINVHLQCIVNNLKKINKMMMLPPLKKFMRKPMEIPNCYFSEDSFTYCF